MTEPDDFKVQLDRLERKVDVIGGIIIFVSALAFGIATGELIQHWGHHEGFGWPASIGVGLAMAVVGYTLQKRFK
jgi:hypothetical protein